MDSFKNQKWLKLYCT